MLVSLIVLAGLSLRAGEADRVQASDAPQSASSFLQAGHKAYEGRDYTAADSLYSLSISTLQEAGLKSKSLVESCIWSAWANIFERDYMDARARLDQASSLRADCCGEDLQLHLDLLAAWEKYYSRTDAPQLALEQAQAILRLEESRRPKLPEALGDAHNQIGRYHFAIGQFEQALESFRHSRDLHPEGKGRIAALNNMAAALRRLDRTEESLEVHEELLKLRLQRAGGKEDRHTLVSRYNVAAVLFDLGKYSESETQVRRFLELYPESSSGYQRNMANAFRLLGNTMQAQADGQPSLLDSAAAVYREGLMLYGIEGPDWSIDRAAQEPEVVGLLEGLMRTGVVSGSSASIASGDQGLILAVQGLRLIDTLRVNYREAVSRTFLADRVAPFYETAMQVAVRGEDFDLAWALAERNKHLSLLRGMTEQEARLRSGLDSALIAQLDALEAELARNYRDLRRKRSRELESQRYDLLSRWDFLLDSLERNSGSYRLLKRQERFAEPMQIQQLLQEQEVMLLLFEGNQYQWTLVLSPDERIIVEETWTQEDRGNFRQLLRTLRDRQQMTRNWESGKKTLASSDQIYRKLAGDWAESSKATRWIVVPDGSWNFLPLEALVTSRTDAAASLQDYPWLGLERSIRYAPSASLFYRLRKSESESGRATLGLAPDYSDDPSLASLAAGPQEMEALSSNFRSDILLDSAASKSRLLDQLEERRYGLLHFAMHAFADSLEPLDSRLVFPGPVALRDSLDLHAWELFQMQLDADLVVLGACESAWGPYQEGEGLHSLSRAFLHSGARSVIGSLWLSADQSSAEIMDEFYSRAALGMPLDVALQQARMAQMKRTDEQGAHPFFWSGYILVGDDQPLKVETAFGSERSIFALILLLAVASLMVFLTEKPV